MLFLVAVAVLAVVTARLSIIGGDQPALWFDAGLVVASALAILGAVRTMRGALVAAAVMLLALGLLALPSIGLFLLLAAALILFAARTNTDAPR